MGYVLLLLFSNVYLYNHGPEVNALDVSLLTSLALFLFLLIFPFSDPKEK